MTKTSYVVLLGVIASACGGGDDPSDAGRLDANVEGDAGSMSDASTDAGPAGGDSGLDAGTDAGPACGAFVACAGEPTVADADGNTYPTVQICGQCWMAENLRVGSDVVVDPLAAPSAQFQTNDGVVERYCPRNLASGCDELGGLYQWNELMGYGSGPRGICPAGWHVPSDDDWKSLERALGMSASEADRRTSGTPRGTDEGTKLKTGGAANFDATLAGFASEMFGRYDISTPGSIGRYWSSTPSSTNAWYRGFSNASAGVDRSFESAQQGYSARCVRD